MKAVLIRKLLFLCRHAVASDRDKQVGDFLMIELFGVAFFGIGLYVLALTARALLKLFQAIWSLGQPSQDQPKGRRSDPDEFDPDGMDPGDYYNGPGGYRGSNGYMSGRESRS